MHNRNGIGGGRLRAISEIDTVAQGSQGSLIYKMNYVLIAIVVIGNILKKNRKYISYEEYEAIATS